MDKHFKEEQGELTRVIPINAYDVYEIDKDSVPQLVDELSRLQEQGYTASLIFRGNGKCYMQFLEKNNYYLNAPGSTRLVLEEDD